jgi:hypothetical protein
MRGGEDPCEVFAQPPPVLDPAEGLDMPGAGQQPELLGFAGGLEEGDAVVGRNHPVGLALDDQDRQRGKRGDPLDRPIAIVDGQAEQPLQRPGRPEARELLPGERAIAGERALDDQGANLGPVRGAGEAGDGDGTAQALAEHHDPVRIDLGHGEERL